MDPHKTHPSATAEGSEREPDERLELRSCVHLGQARELATFRLGERRGRKRDFRYRRFATIDLEMRRCKLPCAPWEVGQKHIPAVNQSTGEG